MALTTSNDIMKAHQKKEPRVFADSFLILTCSGVRLSRNGEGKSRSAYSTLARTQLHRSTVETSRNGECIVFNVLDTFLQPKNLGHQ